MTSLNTPITKHHQVSHTQKVPGSPPINMVLGSTCGLQQIRAEAVSTTEKALFRGVPFKEAPEGNGIVIRSFPVDLKAVRHVCENILCRFVMS